MKAVPRLRTLTLTLLLFLIGVVLLGLAQAQSIKDRHCIVLLSHNLGQQEPLLQTIVATRHRLGIKKEELPVAEFGWDVPLHQRVISGPLALKEYQLPLVSTGLINSAGLPTAANKNRPSLTLPQEVIAYYLINEWARRAGREPHPWKYTSVLEPPRVDQPELRRAGDGSALVLIPEGEFWMGSAEGEIDELPPHKVQLKAYYLGQTEVTVEQFRAFVDETSYQTEAERRGFGFVWVDGDWKRQSGADWQDPEGQGKPAKEDHPVRQVTLQDCLAYCDWAGLRLPTEQEWEKAARGGLGRQFPWGDEWDSRRVVHGGSGPVAVGSHPDGASPYGVLDLTGNVREWTSTLYGAYSPGELLDHASGQRYAVRGGAWTEERTFALRAAYRFSGVGNVSNNLTGFRVADDLDSPMGLRR